MNMADLDIFTAQVRALQAIHGKAHAALSNWGRWSTDRYQIGPKDARTGVWDQFKPDETEAWGEETAQPSTAAPIKAEGPEREPYCEKSGSELDWRIHEGLGEDHRRVLRFTYCTQIPETQLPNLCGCGRDAFREMLESGLKYCGRWA